MQDLQRQYLTRANEIASREYTPYTGQLVQGLTGDQTQARQMLRDRIASGGSQQFRDGRAALDGIIGGGSYTAPGTNQYLGQTTSFDGANPFAGRTTDLGQNSFLGQTTSFDPSNPMAGRRASFDPSNPMAGRRATVGGNAFLGQTTGVGSNQFLGRETEVARNRFLDENNPFLGQVIDNTLGDVTRAFNQQQAPQQLAQFAMGGAFGGSAHLQAMQESQRALAQELGRTATGLRSDDFNARRQLAESEAERLTSTRLADIGRNAGLAQDDINLRANIGQADLARNAELTQRGNEFRADLEDRGIGRDADLIQRSREFGADLEDRGISRDADLFQRSNEFGAQIRQSDLGRNSQLQQDWLRTRAELDQADIGRNADLFQRSNEFGANLRQNDLARNADLAGQGIRNEMDARQFANAQRLQALGMLPSFEDMGIRDIQALNAMGAEERDYLQQLLAANYGQFIDERDWDARQLGIYGNALGQVAPSYSNTTQTGPNPNRQSAGQTALGVGMMAASLFL